MSDLSIILLLQDMQTCAACGDQLSTGFCAQHNTSVAIGGLVSINVNVKIIHLKFCSRSGESLLDLDTVQETNVNIYEVSIMSLVCIINQNHLPFTANSHHGVINFMLGVLIIVLNNLCCEQIV